MTAPFALLDACIEAYWLAVAALAADVEHAICTLAAPTRAPGKMAASWSTLYDGSVL